MKQTIIRDEHGNLSRLLSKDGAMFVCLNGMSGKINAGIGYGDVDELQDIAYTLDNPTEAEYESVSVLEQ